MYTQCDSPVAPPGQSMISMIAFLLIVTAVVWSDCIRHAVIKCSMLPASSCQRQSPVFCGAAQTPRPRVRPVAAAARRVGGGVSRPGPEGGTAPRSAPATGDPVGGGTGGSQAPLPRRRGWIEQYSVDPRLRRCRRRRLDITVAFYSGQSSQLVLVSIVQSVSSGVRIRQPEIPRWSPAVHLVRAQRLHAVRLERRFVSLVG